MAIDIGIPEKSRGKVADGLSRFLADTYTLYLKTHYFHWNVTGPQFNDLHAMFMVQYTELWTAVDLVAERIRSLGSPAPGSYKEFARLTRIAEADGVPKALDMVRELVEGHETACRTAREVFPIAEKANDQVTIDLLTQRLQVHEKTAWMLRSLLE
ncbi:MAG: Dps family protein [Myxococcota bacterium]